LAKDFPASQRGRAASPKDNSPGQSESASDALGYTDKDGEMDKASITRIKGFIGKSQMEVTKYPDAIHHINVFYNDTGKARVFYKYEGNIRFLKTAKK
jgi:hypothetical protein